jgi:opacity protein-like surface antigen
MKKYKTALAVMAMLSPLAALADISFYAGFGPGGVRLEENVNVSVTVDDVAVDPDAFTEPNPNCPSAGPCTYSFPSDGGPFDFQGTDLGLRVFGGVRFLTYFGIELGYVNLGEPDAALDFTVPFGPVNCNPAVNFSCSRPETSGSVTYTDEIDGWELFALGAFPLNDNLEVFGKVGILDWESTFTIKDVAGELFIGSLPNIEVRSLDPEGPVETDGTDLAWGGGINYKVTERLSLRFEGTWYDVEDVDELWMIGGNVIITY